MMLMHQPPDPTISYANLPASFDVTSLLTRLERQLDLEEEKAKNNAEVSAADAAAVGGGGSWKKKIVGDGGVDGNNAIHRVKLIELDPYYHQDHHHDQHGVEPQQHQQHQTLPPPVKTRLLLAIAYGKNIVMGQLIALELGKVVRDDSSEGANAADGEGMNDVDDDNDCDELEWIDFSNARILNPNQIGGGNSNSEGSGDSVFVIFPISHHVDNNLTLDGYALDAIHHCVGKEVGVNNDGCPTVDITSCALIPAPSLHHHGTQRRSKLLTSSMDAQAQCHHPCTVALIVGTACDQVFSLLLNVSVKSFNSTSTSTSVLANNCSSDDEGIGVRFVLEYEECKIIRDGKLLEKVRGMEGDGDDSPVACPIVQQILPYAKIFGLNNDAELQDRAQHATAMGDDDDNSIHVNPDYSHIQVFHPTIALQSLSPSSTASPYDRDGMIPEGSDTYSGIKSITYSRRRTSNFVSGESIKEEEGADAMMNQDMIWITYGNGAIVQLPSWRPFLAFWTSFNTGDIVDVVVNSDNVGSSSVIVPLGSNFPSPLDIPPPRINQCKHHLNSTFDGIESTTQDCYGDDYWKRLCHLVMTSHEAARRHPNPRHASVRALFLPGQTTAPHASMQSIAFLSSRVQYDLSSASIKNEVVDSSSEHELMSKSGKQWSHPADDNHELDTSSERDEYGPVTGKVVGGTAALVKGALGLALGAVRWGLSGKGDVGVRPRSFDDDDDDKNTPIDDFLEADDDSKNIMSSIENAQKSDSRRREKDLVPWPMSCASFAFSDVPRRFESAVVAPCGSLVATTDNLGRVTLFDLDTNQPIRMFKGMRSVSCYFAEVPFNEKGKSDVMRVSVRLYLIIHFRKRGAVEVYRLNQGPRVSSIVVPQQKDCAIISCHGPPSEGSRTNSFLLERMNRLDKDRGDEIQYIIDKLVIDDTDAMRKISSEKPAKSMYQNESKMHLRLLVQLLAPDTNIKCTAQTVLATFKSIHTMSDLGEALDALSKTTRLERDMGIDSSNLLSQAIAYCRSRLKHAKEIEAQEGSGTVRKTAIEEMSSKLAYFDRLVQAYDVLNRYETRNGNSSNEMDNDTGIREYLSPWESEGLYWITATSGNAPLKYNGKKAFGTLNEHPMEFSMFSMSCQSLGNDLAYFSKVKKDRLPVISRVFRPLLQDLFVFKVVNSLIGSLGLEKDFDILQQYFGEWVCSLPIEVIARSNLYGTWHPMIRWLHDLILSAHEVGHGQQKSNNDVLKKIAMLDTLMMFCMDMEDIPKAFLLAVICMDAVSSASIQLEQKTYGEITQHEVVTPWEDLLRKLRVCLLVSVRLEGDVHRIGDVNPMTVNNVSRPDMFSAYYWIALDELSLSHDNQVILALESACLTSPEAFYPTTVDGDREQNRKSIVQSCSSPRYGRSLDDSRTQPLLFYLKDHALFTTRLAANRALILASMWGQSPTNMELLKNAISALQTVVERVEGFSLSTLIEIYQMQLRPVCRALLFGFGEHELSEDIYSNLIEDKSWLGELISAVKQILSMMVDCMPKMSAVRPADTPNSSEMWPPIRECSLLNGLVSKYPNVQLSSVELHHTVIFAFEMTRSVSSLETAVPTLTNLFLAGSLFSPMPHMLEGSVGQQDLLDKAILNHAANSQRPVIDNFSCLSSVELFGKSLGLDSEYVRTRFFIDMIRLGKDSSIHDLLGSSISSLDKAYFSEAVVQIICVRLHSTILSLKQTKKYRGILSLLDADASRWLREEATRCSSSQFATASLITTNSLAMRVHRMFGNSSDESLTKKIGTLCSISETLLKAVQAQEREAVMNL